MNTQPDRSILGMAATVVVTSLTTIAMMLHVSAVRAEPSSIAYSAPQVRAATLPLGELETAFWACDYAATTRGIQATPIEVCSSATEELKNRKFGGDFGEMLEWWRANKSAEHDRIGGL